MLSPIVNHHRSISTIAKMTSVNRHSSTMFKHSTPTQQPLLSLLNVNQDSPTPAIINGYHKIYTIINQYQPSCTANKYQYMYKPILTSTNLCKPLSTIITHEMSCHWSISPRKCITNHCQPVLPITNQYQPFLSLSIM